MGWAALQAQNGSELAARDRLVEAGLPTLCPFETVKRRHRIGRSNNFRLVELPEPIWPGYLFADIEDVTAAERAGRVHAVRRADGSVAPIGQVDMRLLLAAVDTTGRLRDLTLPENFSARVGDTVEIEDGLLSGFRARVMSLDHLAEDGLVWVEFTMIGKSRLIPVPFQSVGDIVQRARKARGGKARPTSGARQDLN